MSAIAPAGSASSITGRLSAASTSATIDGDEESEVINQPAPTSCIQVPMFETIVAIHTLRNSPLRSGLQGDCVLRTAPSSKGRSTILYLQISRLDCDFEDPLRPS